MSEVWLVTGVAGFIGSNLAAHLLSQGATVIGLDNLSSGEIRNLDSFHALPHWHWVLGDINGPELEEIFKTQAITHVLHLAAVVSVSKCEEDPEGARFVNEHGFERVLQLCLQSGVKQLIYASSSAVYGAAEIMPITENFALNPINVYGETKKNNELMAERLTQGSDLSCIGMRFFNLFGPRQSANSPYAAVIPKWTQAIKTGQRPIIYGDGSATRDFCSIENILVAIDCARRVLPKGPHVFNIGTGQITTLNELYALVCQSLGQHPEPQYLPWVPDHIVHSCADISLATTVLGYQPEVGLIQGLNSLFH